MTIIVLFERVQIVIIVLGGLTENMVMCWSILIEHEKNESVAKRLVLLFSTRFSFQLLI